VAGVWWLLVFPHWCLLEKEQPPVTSHRGTKSNHGSVWWFLFFPTTQNQLTLCSCTRSSTPVGLTKSSLVKTLALICEHTQQLAIEQGCSIKDIPAKAEDARQGHVGFTNLGQSWVNVCFLIEVDGWLNATFSKPSGT
jgi:hypothetical protein